MREVKHRPGRHRGPRQPRSRRPPGPRRTCIRGRVAEGQRRVSVDRHPASSRPAREHSRPRTSMWIWTAAIWVFDTNDLGKVRLQVESRDDKPGVRGHRPDERRGELPPGRLTQARSADVDASPFQADYGDPRVDRRPAAPTGLTDLGRIRAGARGKQTLNWEDRGRRLLGRGDERRRLRRSRRRRQHGRQHPVPRRDRMDRGWQRRVRAPHGHRHDRARHTPPEQPGRRRNGPGRRPRQWLLRPPRKQNRRTAPPPGFWPGGGSLATLRAPLIPDPSWDVW